jgi:hypothetical protein
MVTATSPRGREQPRVAEKGYLSIMELDGVDHVYDGRTRPTLSQSLSRGGIVTMRRLLFVGLIFVAVAVVTGHGAPAAVSAQAGTATPTAGFIGLPEGISAWRVSEVS